MFLFALIIWETKVLDCLVWTVGSLFQLLFLSLLYFQVLQALVSFPSACRWVRISSAFCLRIPLSSLDLLLFFSQSRSLRQELALRVYMGSPWLSSPQSPRSSHGLSIRQPPLSETALAKSPTSKPMSTSQSLLHLTFLKKKIIIIIISCLSLFHPSVHDPSLTQFASQLMSSFFPALAGTLCDILILPLFFYAIYSSWAKPSTPRGSAITWVLIGSKLVLLAQVSLSWAPDTYSRMSPFNKQLTIRYVNKIKLLSCLLNSVLLV